MQIVKYARTQLYILMVAAILGLSLAGPASGAADQPAAAPPAAEIKVPDGTLDAVTAILTRRSIRNYTSRPVPEELVKLLVTAGMNAPSAFNERSTEFVVIRDPKVMEDIAKTNPASMQLKRASTAIVIAGNQGKEKFPGQGYWQLDGAVAAQNILVAAHAVGLGAVWTAIYPYPDRMAAIHKLLKLPEPVTPLCVIPLGYPAEQKPRENRFDPARLHTNTW